MSSFTKQVRQLCIVIGIMLFASAAQAETKLAVLIGINCYNPTAADCAKLYQAPRTSAYPRPAFTGKWLIWQYDNLTGAVADVDLMKGILTPLGFGTVTLTDEQATADAILTALRQNLVIDAKAGDTRLVYYSGHGNFVRNTASKESDGYDQTIVPADHFRGVADVRDKELSRILFEAGSKGVKVIFIADSCHSGSISRGAWNARRTKTAREGSATAKDSPVVNDPADIDKKTGKPIDPASVGVITFSAAQRSESAQEIDISHNTDGDLPFGPSHGAFTWALKTALESGLNQSLETLNRRVAALMQANNLTQVPALDGKNQSGRTLFGEEAGTAATQTVVVVSVNNDNTLLVRGGKAIGIYPGTQLKRMEKGRPPVEIEITKGDKDLGLALSSARIVEPKQGDFHIQPGELFEVDKWVVPVDSLLKVYVPPAAPEATVYRTATEVGKLRSDTRIHWLEDPTLGHPTHIMNWNGKDWTLDNVPQRIEIKDAKGRVAHVQHSTVPPPVNLGATPSAEDIRSHLPDGATFFLLLPPTDVMLEKLGPIAQRLGGAIRVVHKAEEAHYLMEGRSVVGNVEYAWIIPDATEEDVQTKTSFQLPTRSDWIPTQADVTDAPGRAVSQMMDKAQRIARLREWLVLPDPPSPFPYSLAFRQLGTDQYVDSGNLREGNKYKMYLKSSPDRVRDGVAPRWVYIFAIDHFGKGTLLFPERGRGNEGNQFPRKGEPGAAPPALIGVSGEKLDEDFSIGPPFGLDTYIMLTTEQPIENPEIFEFDGPRSRGARGADSANPLEALLSDVGTASRGPQKPVPTNWNIQRLAIRSVPK